MAVDCQNIYKNARKSAGMTQEKAAQLLNVSVDSLRDYEQSQRPVPSDVASAMCDVYQAPYLAVQHLRRSSELGKRVVPEISVKGLAGSCSQRSGGGSEVYRKARCDDRDRRRWKNRRGRTG